MTYIRTSDRNTEVTIELSERNSFWCFLCIQEDRAGKLDDGIPLEQNCARHESVSMHLRQRPKPVLGVDA